MLAFTVAGIHSAGIHSAGIGTLKVASGAMALASEEVQCWRSMSCLSFSNLLQCCLLISRHASVDLNPTFMVLRSKHFHAKVSEHATDQAAVGYHNGRQTGLYHEDGLLDNRSNRQNGEYFVNSEQHRLSQKVSACEGMQGS